jgi:carboxyl-terminal processing protease
MPLRNLVWLLVIPGLVALALVLGYSAPAPDRDYRLVRQIVEVLAEVDANYVRQLTDEERQQFVEDMINGGLHSLDPNSQYFNEQQLKRFETDNEGSFGGVGIRMGRDENSKLLKVEYPMVGTPAYEAGVVAGDLIVKVDDESAEGWTNEQAQKKITGEPGTNVTITLRREGRNPPEFPVTLTRARIAMHTAAGISRRADDPVKWNWFIDSQNKIAVIRIQSQFNELTAKEVKAAVEEIEAAGAKALILDLRDNPGGLLSQAIEVADLFLPEGKIVTTKDRRGGAKASTAHRSGTMFLPIDQKPMVVLVNDRSASASEIVAAALQDNGRAVVVGERSYGKGSVQSLFRLAPDQKTAVKLTTQSYLRPTGKNMDRKAAPKDSPDEWGVTPDEGLAVPMTEVEKLRYVFEMERIKYAAGRPDVVGPKPPPYVLPVPKDNGKPMWDESKPFEDRQMIRALEYLRNKLVGAGAVRIRMNSIPA